MDKASAPWFGGWMMLHAHVVATPPPRTRVEDAWCEAATGSIRLLAHTAEGIEAWDAERGWRLVVPHAGHSGNVTGIAGATFARWKKTPVGDYQAEIGIVGMDGSTVWTKDLLYLSNTTTEVSALWGTPVTFALKYHTRFAAWVSRDGEPSSAARAIRIMADPAILYFSRDGTHLLLGGNGLLAVADLAADTIVSIDATQEQRASAFSADERAVVYGSPEGDRTRVAKASVTGERVWTSEPLTEEARTWGTQAIAYVPTFKAWIGVIDNTVVALRDRDGHRIPLEAELPASQWTGYDQLADWFRPPAIATSCGGPYVLVGNMGGTLEVWELSRH